MKRCIICDSSEEIDSLAELGFTTKITEWILDESGDYMCNRCYDSISDTKADLEILDEDYEEEYPIVLTLEFDK